MSHVGCLSCDGCHYLAGSRTNDAIKPGNSLTTDGTVSVVCEYNRVTMSAETLKIEEPLSVEVMCCTVVPLADGTTTGTSCTVFDPEMPDLSLGTGMATAITHVYLCAIMADLDYHGRLSPSTDYSPESGYG